MDALGEWGMHNTAWRAGREIRDILEGAEFALTYYSPLVARILVAGPLSCLRTEISAEDLPHLLIADGRPATEWTTAVQQDASRSGADVRALAAASQPVTGPLVCTCVGETVDGGLRLRPPFVIFDGWHRGAAWILHGQSGKVYPISANVIVTERPAPLLGRA